MPAMDEEDRPKKKIAHEIGQDVTLLSVKELDERVGLLKEEIARLEADKVKKQAQSSAADLFFKRKGPRCPLCAPRRAGGGPRARGASRQAPASRSADRGPR